MPQPDSADEKPGAVGTADRVGFDTPGEVRGHSMSSPIASSSLVAKWRMLAEIKRNRELSGTDWSVLVAVLDRMGQNATSWPGLSKISNDIGADRSSVVRSIKRLCGFGYLVRESGNARKSNTYSMGFSRCESAPRCDAAPSSESAPNLGANLRLGVGANLSLEVGANLHPESALRESVSKEPVKEPAKKHSPASRAGDQEGIDESFDRFWSAYPRKVSKPDALKAWKQAAEHVEAIVSDLAKRVADPEHWNDSKFIPYPATYLRRQQWLDEWQPQTITDRIRKSAEAFGDYDFGKPRAGRVSVPNPQQAAELNAKADARLAKFRPSVTDSFEGKVYVGTPDHELPDWLKDEATP